MTGLAGVAVLVGALAGGVFGEGEAAEDNPQAAPGYPDETTTGVPAGVTLEPSGSLTITRDGALVEGLHITGTLIVRADDVTVRNTRISTTGTFAIRVDGGRNLLVEDTEIDGQSRGAAAVAFNNYTLRRVNIHHVTEGPRIAGGKVTIVDSYIHHLVQKDDNHTDAVQAVSGRQIVLRGNTLEVFNPDTGSLGNAAFMFGAEEGPLDDCLVEGNFMNGGNYTVNGGGGGTDSAACVFRDNVFGRDFRHGVHGNLGPKVDWEATNRWRDTGESVS